MTHKKCHPPVFMTGGMTFFSFVPGSLTVCSLYDARQPGSRFRMPASPDSATGYLLSGSRFRIPIAFETLPGSRSIFVDVDFFKGETLGSLCRKLLIWNSQGKDRFKPAL